jgi:HK97 family phage portal protein
MAFKDWFRKVEVKANPIGEALLISGGQGWQRPSNTRAYISEGYQLNVVVYRAVREIASSVADFVIEVKQGDKVLDSHPALDLLRRPNPQQSWDGFIQQVFIDYLLTGEMAIVAANEGIPSELWPISPLNVEVVPGPGGLPKAYVHKLNGYTRTFDVDRITGMSDFFFMKMYDPTNYWRGQSPLVAAGLAADTHNAGMQWNYRLLRNSARPSGLIKMTGEAGGEIVGRIKEWFKAAYQGNANAGEIPVLPSGAEWVPMDNSPRDMDFVTTQKEAAKLIASAYGVPLPLIDNDASTFNNMEQAKELFYTGTLIPLFNSFLSQFGNWLLSRYGDDLSFGIDMDQIAALDAARARKFDRVIRAHQANIITTDEAREAIGYKPVGGAASILDPMGGFDLPPGEAPSKALKLVYGD